MSSTITIQPMVSVVIPVYNRKDFIAQCLDSVLNQDFSDFEIIVVDDGSSDGTRELLNSYASRVRLHFHDHNKGVSQARNQGIQLSRARFVAMIDSDCIADPSWLRELLRPFEQDTNIMIVGGRVKDVLSSNYWQMVNTGFSTFVAQTNGYVRQIIGCNLALRRDFAIQHPYDTRLKFAAGDDTELCWRCHKLGFNVFYTHQAIVTHYHRNTCKSSVIQQFLYGYINSYLRVKFDYFPYIPYGGLLLLILVLLIVVGLILPIGLSMAFLMPLPIWLLFSFNLWNRGRQAQLRIGLHHLLTYPGHYLLGSAFYLGCISYFVISNYFLSDQDNGSDHNSEKIHWPSIVLRKVYLYIYVFWLKCCNPKMQISFAEAILISKAITSRKNCRLLVFGSGYDTPFWLRINAQGRTIFIEDDSHWFNLVKQRSLQIEIHQVDYQTQLSQWPELLKEPKQLSMRLPDEIIETDWDVILVDAPCGQLDYFLRTFGKEPPGRMKSIYMASKLIAEGGDVFIHDCQRPTEEIYAARFLRQSNYVNQVVGNNNILRHYHLDKKEVDIAPSRIRVALLSPFLPVPPVKGGGIEQGIINTIAHFHNVDFSVFSHTYDLGRTTFIRGPNAEYIQFPINSLLYALQVKWNYTIAQKYFFNSFDYLLIRKVVDYLKDPPDIIEVRNNFYYIPLLKKYFPHSRFLLKMHNEYFFASPRLFQLYIEIIEAVDAIIVVSQYLKDRIMAHYPIAEKKIQVVHNGVALNRFHRLPSDDANLSIWRRKLNLNGNSNKIFIFVGRIAPMKGVEYLIAAFQQLLKRHADARLLIVGSSWFAETGQTPYLQKIQRMTQPLKDAVIFTGFVGHEQLNYLYNLASVCVVPSIWQEPFGLVNLEAMAAGCAVIASRVGGIPEIIADGQNGLLIEPANQHDLLEKMLLLLESPEQREQLAQTGLAHVQAVGNWSITAQKTEKIYQDIVNESGA